MSCLCSAMAGTCTNYHDASDCFKVLELYSGIGGLNYALEKLDLGIQLDVTAMDINTTANHVHSINFPNKKISDRNLLSLSPGEVDRMKLDLLAMSPPCQPFTRQGLQRDVGDVRCDSFKHIVDNVLPKLTCKPKYIFLENVKGFEVSEAHKRFIEVLTAIGYDFREFLVSPTLLGIPNSRLRYYMMAKLKSNSEFKFDCDGVSEKIPQVKVTCSKCRERFFGQIELESLTPTFEARTLESFIEKQPASYFDQYLLSDKLLDKYSFILDIVNLNSTRTCCFTRGYGHLVQGTGSVLQMNNEHETEAYFNTLPRYDVNEDDDTKLNRISKLRILKLRHFTPREVANLMCFPETFIIPEDVSARQMYKVLGNSVNVDVVSFMLKLLIL
ncbi:tRNA (cytosine(38)-C(5))-methyltransferase [Halotydeus destructor]|nr:tRNA (cytosine(38)-C(5))-methyltransferase [Halotydeus destructor]